MTPGITIGGVQRRFAGDISELICLLCENCVDLCNTNIYRFVEDHKEQTFEVISELLEDKTLKISMLAGLGPVWDGEVKKGVNGVKKELINYWIGEARKGRTIGEVARYNDSLLDIIANIVPKWKVFDNQFVCRVRDHPELADLVVNERERRTTGIAD